MALNLESIKKDFARNKKRSMILAALSLVMVGFVVKAYFEMAPRSAVADSNSAATPTAPDNTDTLSAAETDARIRQSKELWAKLREQRGSVTPAIAFAFVPSFYLPDPSKVHEATNTHVVIAPLPEPVNPQSEEDRKRKLDESRVRQRASGLVLNSVVVGSGNSRPVAVISNSKIRGKILGIGDEIDGFKCISIKSRSVDFTMDGITVSVPMANSTPSGQ